MASSFATYRRTATSVGAGALGLLASAPALAQTVNCADLPVAVNAATPPPIIRWSTPWSLQALTALRVSTSVTASWKEAATSAIGTVSPARRVASTQRASVSTRGAVAKPHRPVVPP